MWNTIKLYTDRRVLAVGALGFASGLPLLLTLSTLDIWLAVGGMSKTIIGLFAFVGLPYTLKFLWAPLVDHWNLPFFTKRFGRRRGWALFSQVLVISSIGLMSQIDPVHAPTMMAAAALLVAFSSATQDIVIDALRVDVLDKPQYGAGAAMVVMGYRFGMLAAGAGALYLATFFSWHDVYLLMAALMVIGVLAVLSLPEPTFKPRKSKHNILQTAIIDPFKDFTARMPWVWVLVFVVVFKTGDAMLSKMAGPFYIEMGFTLAQIAAVSKIYGSIATIIGGLLGGVLVYRYGLWRSLVVTGVLQVASNLVFIYQAHMGADVPTLAMTITIENLSGGMGTAAFVAYLSALCSKQFTATQYALLSALMSLPRTVLTAGSGWLAETFTWPEFFLLTAVLGVPGVLMLWLWRARVMPAAPQTKPKIRRNTAARSGSRSK